MSKLQQRKFVDRYMYSRIVEYLSDQNFNCSIRSRDLDVTVTGVCSKTAQSRFAGAWALADLICQWPVLPQAYEEKIRIAVMMIGRENVESLLDAIEVSETCRLWIRYVVNASVLHASELVVDSRDLMGPEVELQCGHMICECLDELLWICVLDPSQNTRPQLLNHARIWRDKQ